MNKDIEISELRKLTLVILEKYGYDFSDYALSSFKRRILRLLEIHKVSSISELIEVLSVSDFTKLFLSELTVNVTEMFRDPSMWVLLKNKVIPSLFEYKSELKIWHAGCASGEEVISLAILLDKLGVSSKVSLTASDIDPIVLDKARASKFSAKSMELNCSNFEEIFEDDLSVYFDCDENTWATKKSLLSNINFVEHNLVNDEVLGSFDIILCRNVLIYFNQNLQNKVLEHFIGHMERGSFLIIGSKESLIWCDAVGHFKEIDSEEKVYQKIRS